VQRRTGFRRSLIGWAPERRPGRSTGFRTRLLVPLVVLGVGLFLTLDLFLLVRLMSDRDPTPSADRPSKLSSVGSREVPAGANRIEIGAPMLSDADVARIGGGNDRAGGGERGPAGAGPSPAASGSSSTGSSSTGSSSTGSSDSSGSDSGGTGSGDSGDSGDPEPPVEEGPGGAGP